MRGRYSHHCNATINVRNIELDVVFVGTLDFDEGQFEVDYVHLSEGRGKFAGVEDYKIPARLHGFIMQHCQEDAHDAAWGSA